MLWRWVASTVVLGTTASFGSVTVPVMVANVVWAKAAVVATVNNKTDLRTARV